MDLIKSSLFYNVVNCLDINYKLITEQFKNSFIITKLQSGFEVLQDKLSFISRNSDLVKYIDKIILSLLSLILIIIPVSSTGIIGGLVLLAFLTLLAKFCLVKGTKIEFSSIDLPIFIYIAIAGLSVAFSSLLMPSIKGYIKMLVYFGGYLTFFNIMKNNPKRLIYMMALLATTGATEAIFAIYQQIIGVEPLASWQDLNEVNPEQLMNRVYGTLKPYNPNLLAGYLVATLSSTLGCGFLTLNKKKYICSGLSFIGTLLILAAIVFTGSRGAYMATAAMIAVFIAISGHIISTDLKEFKLLKQVWSGCIALGAIGVTAMVLISPAIQHRIGSIFILRGDSSNSYRFNVYASTLKMFVDNWFIGIGTGNTTFRLMYGLYMVTGFDALGAYNIFLEIAAESGIFALLAFLWILIAGLIRAIKVIINNNSMNSKIIASSCIIGVTGMMIHGFFDTVWYRPQINIIFWLTIAILAVVVSGKFEEEKA